MVRMIVLLLCLIAGMNNALAQTGSFNYGTWNMEGATSNNEDIWGTAVRALMTGYYNGSRIRLTEPGLVPVDMEPSDVIALQETGARPNSATVPTTPGWDGVNTEWALQSNPNARVTEYQWNGWWLYHMPVARENQDPAQGRRTNLAIVSRYRADGLQIVPRQMNEDDPGSAANRENFGIRVTNPNSGEQAWFYTFHASSFGPEAEHRNNVNTVLDRISIDRDNFGGRWVVLGDYNRDPRNNGLNGLPSTGTIPGVDNQPPIYYRYAPARPTRPGSGRILDYAVADHLVMGVAPMLVDVLAQFSDHVPVVYQYNLRGAGEQNSTYAEVAAINEGISVCYDDNDTLVEGHAHRCGNNVGAALKEYGNLHPLRGSWNTAKGMFWCTSFLPAAPAELFISQFQEMGQVMECQDQGRIAEKHSYGPPGDFRRRLRADEDHLGFEGRSFTRLKVNHENVYYRKDPSREIFTKLWASGDNGGAADVFSRVDHVTVTIDASEMPHYDPNVDVSPLHVVLPVQPGGQIDVPDEMVNVMDYLTGQPGVFEQAIDRAKDALASGREDELDNGIPVNNIDLETGETVTFKFPTAFDSLAGFNIVGNNGDADIYVRKGAPPTLSTYDCRPYTGGSNESCLLYSEYSAETYYVMVRAYRSFTDVSLTANFSPIGGSSRQDEQVTDISVDADDWYYHSVYLGDGIYSSLNVSISGGSGDADLYLQPAGVPTLSTYACRPWINGNNETCTINNPTSGLWYIGLHGWNDSAGVTLNITANP